MILTIKTFAGNKDVMKVYVCKFSIAMANTGLILLYLGVYTLTDSSVSPELNSNRVHH